MTAEFVKTSKSILPALIGTAAVARVMMFWMTGHFLDDPFITYRYAENLVHGLGFVYNPGEHVLGTTTPLYTLLLAGLGVVFGSEHIPAASIAVSVIADLISVFLLWRLLANLTEPVRVIVCLLFALYPKTVLIGISGMEASLVVLLMLLSFKFMAGKRYVPAYAVFGAILLTRIDGIIWVCVVVAWFTVVVRRGGGRAVPVTLVVLTPWLLFSWIYFGSILPHSIIAKRVSWHHLYPAFDPVRVLIRYFPFEGMSGWDLIGKSILVVMFLVPIAAGTVLLFRKKEPLGVFPFFFIVYSAFFSSARVSTDIWYYLPGYVAYFVTAGCVVDRLLTGAQGAKKSKGRFPVILASAAALILLLGIGMARWSQNPGDWFHRHFMDLGLWIRDHASRDDSVFLEGIGYVGWESKIYVHDAVGLVSPDVLEYRKRYPRSDFWYLKYLAHYEPEFIVLRNWEIEKDTLFLGWGDGLFNEVDDRAWFFDRYEEVPWSERIREDSVHFVLFRRR